jgi:signal transduction histidine kinase
VFRIARSALVKGLDDPGPIPTLLFDHHDGMPSRETQGGAQPLAWATREGDLYIPTSRGLARLDGKAAQPLSLPLRLHKLKAESDETILPEGDPIEVPAGTHRFEIYYTATALTRADKVRFRYRLEGLESVWNEVGDRRFAAYSNLPPGSYRFALQAWRLDEESPPQELFLPVHIRPFFHQRAAFWIFCAFILAAFGWWLLRLRLQQLEARTAVFAERNRMAREIHDHLAQGFTGVLLQLEAAEARLTHMQGDPAPILTRLEHARSLAAASLQEARRSVMTLRPRRPAGTDLLGALHELADRLLTGTDIQVELAQSGRVRQLGDYLEEELLRMGQEALTNALRHGRARWVRVTLRFEERRVHLSIADDGQGFDPKAGGGGYGLRSIRETIKRLKGHLDVDSSLGLGSCITITLPIRRWRP